MTDAVDALIDAFEALDQWMTKGGFSPWNYLDGHYLSHDPLPNGRCPTCGTGLDDQHACQDDTCQEYGSVIPDEEIA